MAEEQSKLRILTQRGGTVKEITDYLIDMERAYESLYAFNLKMDYFNPNNKRFRRFRPWMFEEFGLTSILEPFRKQEDIIILPEYKLIVDKVSIQSPGFWEFAGMLNPLQQIREYLNDRHRRRQDIEWREMSEKQKAQLEVKIMESQLIEKEDSIISERIKIFRELGFSTDEVRQLIWSNVGISLMRLGKHQDKGIIDNAE